jgi:hypothetical protein
MSDTYDYSGIIRQQTAGPANAAIAATDGVPPEAAATALQHGPNANVNPAVGMYSPQEVQQQAATTQQQQVLGQNSRVAAWIAAANPAHVAAAKDDLPGLAKISDKLQESPWAVPAGNPLQAIGTMIANQYKEGEQQYKEALAQKHQGGLGNWISGAYNAIQAGIGGASAPIAPVINAAGDTYYHWSVDAGATPEQAKAQTETFLTDLMLGDAIPGIHGGGALADPIVGGRGGKPEADAIRAGVAQVDAAKATGLQETIANTQVHARSPSTMSDFIGSQVPERVVHVDPDAIIEHVLAQGHDLPWPELGPQMARAVSDGDMLEVPFERYHSEVAGQPYAEALNSNTIFREGGMTLEDAKGVKPEAEGEAAQPTTKAPIELPEDFTPEETTRATTLAAKAETATEQVFREQYLTPVPINHAGDIGMTTEELTQYGDRMRAASEEARSRAVDTAVRQIKREREPEWKEALAKHTEDGRQEVEAQRNVIARRLLQGDKLDTDLLKVKYPDEFARLPKDIHGKLGLIPDDAVGEELGYGSLKEMLNDQAFLHQAATDVGAKNLDQYVDKRAKAIGQARTEQQLGDNFFTPEGLREMAMRLVPEDKAEGTLIDEWRYTAKLAGKEGINLGDIKAQAKESFRGQRVGDVTNIQRLNDRIFRLAEKAQRALAKDQFGAAFGYKQLQFQRRLQLKEALSFRRDFNAATKQWSWLAGSRTLPNMDQMALNFIHSIQAEMGYPVSTHAADLPAISDLPNYINARNTAGGELIQSDIPPRDNQPIGKYLNSLTTDQFRGLQDMFQSMAKDGRNQQQVTRAGKAQSVDAVRTATINSLNRYSRDIGREERESPTVVQKLDATRRGWDSALVRMEQLLLDFTGRDPDHPLMDIWHQMMDGKGWKDDKLIAMSKHFESIGKQLGKGFDDWLEARVGDAAAGTGFLPPATRSGDHLFITNKDVVVASAHMGDAEALRKFAEGYETTPAAIEAIVHTHMTNDAWTYTQGMWDAFGMMSKDAQEAYLNRSGVHLQMVEPRPFEVPDKAGNNPVKATVGRKFSGGYYPISYDWDNLPQTQKMMLQSDEVLGAKEFRTFTPASNYLKARTKFTGPIDMSLDMVYTRLRQMAHDIAYRDPLMDMQKVLLHPDVKDAIATKYGPEYIRTVEDYIKAVAGAETGGGKGMRVLTNAVNYLSNAQQISLIGFNPGTVFKHGLTAAFHSMQTVGPGEFLKASVDLYRGGGDLRRQLDTESSELRYRHLNANERARESFENLQGEDNWRSKIKRASVWAIAELDKESARQVYMAAKQKELDRQTANGQPLDQDKAIALGNQAVRQAHGSTGVTDAAAILRADDSLWGAIASSETRFMNFFNHNYNRMREIPQAFGYAGEAPDVARGLGLLLTYGAITGSVGAIIGGEVSIGIPILSDIANAAAWVAGGMKGTPRGGMLMQFGFLYGHVANDIAQVVGDKNTNSPAHRRHIQNLIADGSNAALTTAQLPGNVVAKLERFAFHIADPHAYPKRSVH